MLEEQLEIVHGLWGEPDGWSFRGTHYTVEEARFRAKPLDAPGRPRSASGQPRPRIIVGGGSPRSIRIAARWADEYNLTSSNPEQVAEKYAQLDAALDAAGRDRGEVTRSAMVGVLVGGDEAELERREGALLEALGAEEAAEEWFEERRARWIHGTPEAARESVRRFAAAGVERIMLQDFLPRDLEMIDLMGRELIGQA
jgi:alkanesulfonate monooxygenase SsuD/methylene tetrahydromethanopterin reductase-like flavin-dependent oxidoreductase (luciferase family)